jgi:cytochrome c oxidase subunit 2
MRVRRVPLVAAIGSISLLVTVLACGGQFPQSALHPTSDFGYALDDLFRTIFWLALGVFVVVESLLLYVIIRYRARPGQPPPPRVHGNTLLETAWTLAPAVILVFVAVPTIQTVFRTDGSAPEGALEIDVIGHQWWWEYRYPDYGIVTANELHVPRGRPVVLKLTSADVIHSFWAPRIGGKRDAIPRRQNRLAFTADSMGVFMGQCAEFCGQSHARMGLRVVVQDSSDFAAWVVAQTASPVPEDSLTELERAGFEEFRKIRSPASNSCIACHAVKGISAGVLGPDLTHLASRSTIAAGVLANDSASLARWLRDPEAIKPGSKMPTIGLSDDEIAALVAYLRRLR